MPNSSSQDSIPSTPCPGEHTLVEYAEGNLRAPGPDALREHVAFCERCQAAVADVAAADEVGGTGSLANRANPCVLSGRYRIEERLGQGAMGVVYAARDLELDRRVAIKLLWPRDGTGGQTWEPDLRTAADAPATVGRARAEARALARLADPRIVQVFDVGWSPHGVFIAMELVSGTSLRRWMTERPRSWQAVVARFVLAARALAAAHAQGIIHRDFKPDNVMVVGEGIKILDFGIAAEASAHLMSPALDGIPAAFEFAGTPAYMAPEAHRGCANASTDQYAFFVALYEALLQRKPFTGGTIEALFDVKSRWPHQHSFEHTGLPVWLARAIERGLAPARHGRHADLRAVARLLERGLRQRTRGTGRWLASGIVGAVALLGNPLSSNSGDGAKAAHFAPHARSDPAFDNAPNHPSPRSVAGLVARWAERQQLDRIAAAAWLAEGKAASDAREFEPARTALEAAYRASVRAGTDGMSARVAVRLAFVHLSGNNDHDAALQWTRHARAALARAGRDPSAEPDLQTVLGLALLRTSKPANALTHLRRAQQLATTPAEQAVAAMNIGVALSLLGQFQNAGEIFAEAVRIREGFLGVEHPQTVDAVINETNAWLDAGDLGATEAGIRSLHARLDRQKAQPIHLAAAFGFEAELATLRGEHDRALSAHLQSLAFAQRSLDAHDPMLTSQELGVAHALVAVGRCADALERTAHGRTLLEEAGRSNTPQYARFEHCAFEASVCLSDPHGARARLSSAIDRLAGVDPEASELPSWRSSLAELERPAVAARSTRRAATRSSSPPYLGQGAER